MGRFIAVLLASLCLSFVANDTRASSFGVFNVLGGGVTAPSTNGACAAGASLCLNQDQLFELNGAGLASVAGLSTVFVAGTDNPAVFASFNVVVPTLSFIRVAGASGPGIVEEILFTGLTYSGSATVDAAGDPVAGSFTSTLNLGSGVTGVSGNYQTFDSVGAPVDALASLGSLSPFLSALSCSISVAFGQCNVSFGAFGLSAGGESLDVIHQLTLHVDPPLPVPEPAIPALLLAALSGLGLRRLLAG